MGYYSKFDIYFSIKPVTADTNPESIIMEDIAFTDDDVLSELIESVSGYSVDSICDDIVKWYNFEEDMQKISENFTKDILFRVDRTGEDEIKQSSFYLNGNTYCQLEQHYGKEALPDLKYLFGVFKVTSDEIASSIKLGRCPQCDTHNSIYTSINIDSTIYAEQIHLSHSCSECKSVFNTAYQVYSANQVK